MSGLSLHIYINRRNVDFVGYVKNYWIKRLNNMFKDTKEGETHSYNDGCGEPAHNPKLPQHIEERFDKEFPLIKETGIEEAEGVFLTETDSEKVKSFIATILEEERGRVVKKIEKMMNEYRMRECPIKGRMSQCTKYMCFHWTPSWENIINLIKEE